MDCKSKSSDNTPVGRRTTITPGARLQDSNIGSSEKLSGDDLGKVKEIMVDLQSGRVAYVVLAFGGFMGIGEKLFAVPWDELMIDEGNQELVLNASVNQLDSAPGFAKDNCLTRQIRIGEHSFTITMRAGHHAAFRSRRI